MRYRPPPPNETPFHVPYHRYREYEPAGPPWRAAAGREADHAAFEPRDVPTLRGWWRRRGHAERCMAPALLDRMELIRPKKRPRPALGPCEVTMGYLLGVQAELIARREPHPYGHIRNPQRAFGEQTLDHYLVLAMADWIYALAEDYARRAGRRPFRPGPWIWPRHDPP